jgi:antitoxin VapB
MVYIYHRAHAMALNIKNPEVERLAAEVAQLTGESKTEAIRKALSERQARLRVRVAAGARAQRVRRFLEREIWARVPPDQRGKPPTKEERERILGFGGEGV